MAWPIVDFNGARYYQGQGITLVPVDGTGVAHVLLREDGGIVGGVSAVEQGPPGQPAGLDPAIALTPLAFGDTTPDSAFFELISPPTSTAPGVWKMHLALHVGKDGEPGTMVWNPADLSATPKAGWLPAVEAGADGFELVPYKLPEVFYPGSISNIGSGNVNATHAQINIPARPWARRIRAQGFTVITGEAADVRVNLLARLNGEADGNIVGRCVGIAQVDRLAFSPGKPIQEGTSADGYDTIAAGASATVHIRCERQAGSSTYTAAAAMAHFNVEAWPL
ncbi:hypothetical protein [Mycobacteroides immunogenum]|uniref:Uncharacterized protein n=1 Tax=Mycobacteroides immunogenum TaxID=83262 RepID=A0A7V8LR25_9MYCO|nr:hypothetical protein [Mycobacteroides immunogenum]AMT72036.1 hypothetical protein ABG82_18825 [Mycobacteroides immunogenum]ANO05166.1 hypothetical protein BAB75_19095 [Mycobacteroides immunogenum]KIU40163.1 hypothetical protein TL11_12855 [Mycobacteroides immunogenum]KPG13662.1 hypothetical protein AN909_05130 [Mycobacteroides immunogenum]KPG14417.1 hypothetical protein AN908_07735 [Mycobacteroides immunogenum]